MNSVYSLPTILPTKFTDEIYSIGNSVSKNGTSSFFFLCFNFFPQCYSLKIFVCIYQFSSSYRLSFPPRLKQQPSASATPLHFQQQPSLLSSGNTNFSDLSSNHREQQQLFLFSHGCRHPYVLSTSIKRTSRERRKTGEHSTDKESTERRPREERKENRGEEDGFSRPALHYRHLHLQVPQHFGRSPP